MRFMMMATPQIDRTNAAMKEGRFAGQIQSIMDEIRPEAAYFAEIDGERSAIFIVNIEDASGIPAVAEPFFQGLNAKVRFHPVMLPEDLMRAGPAIDAAAERYG